MLLEALSLQGILWNLTPRNKVRALAGSGHTDGTCDPEAAGTRGREILAFCAELGEASVLWANLCLGPGSSTQSSPQ